MRILAGVIAALVLGAFITVAAQAPQPPAGGGQPAPPQPMTFFVTSAGPGNGANLGGVAGADRHCQQLAAAAGAGNNGTWRAYLSTSASGGQPAVNARDRIGAGPWYNAKNARIAQNVADLHGDTLEQARRGNNLTKVTALNEKGETINGVGDTPNRHDILTGSQLDGTAYADGNDHTCQNWTSNGTTGSAQLGHSDRTGGGNTSWNSTHASRGCSQENLVSTGGAGLFYCFAVR
jgi:hypothetical protein